MSSPFCKNPRRLKHISMPSSVALVQVSSIMAYRLGSMAYARCCPTQMSAMCEGGRRGCTTSYTHHWHTMGRGSMRMQEGERVRRGRELSTTAGVATIVRLLHDHVRIVCLWQCMAGGECLRACRCAPLRAMLELPHVNLGQVPPTNQTTVHIPYVDMVLSRLWRTTVSVSRMHI